MSQGTNQLKILELIKNVYEILSGNKKTSKREKNKQQQLRTKQKLKFAIELYGYPAASNRIRLPIDRT